jgi:hypothetical protein
MKLTVSLVAQDEDGNEVMRIPGPRLPVTNLVVPGTDALSMDLVMTAFARMFGFYRG